MRCYLVKWVVKKEDDGIVNYVPVQTETWKNCTLSKDLTALEIGQLQNLMQEKSILFSDKPGRTNVTTFKIDTGDASPISQRPYQLAQALRKPVEQEIATLLEQGIITESISEWSSPIMVRRKMKDGKMEGVRI